MPFRVPPDFGEKLAAALAQNTFSRVSFESNFSPPITFDVAAEVAGPPGLFSQLAQPRVVLDGPAGHVELAPYGVPSLGGAAGVLVAVAVLAGAFALGFAVARG